MRPASAEVVLENTAVFLHGIGASVGLAGLVYHGSKKQWGYCCLAFVITVFHGASAVHHNEVRKEALHAVRSG